LKPPTGNRRDDKGGTSAIDITMSSGISRQIGSSTNGTGQ